MHLRIHDKYITASFLRNFAFSTFAFTLIYVIVDVFEEIDNYIDHDTSVGTVARYYFYSLPFILTYIVPTALLLATVFSLGVLARRNELTALVASGVSMVRLAMPLILIALAISAFSAWFNDAPVAHANRIRLDIKHYEIEGQPRPMGQIRKDFQYLGDEGYVYLASTYNPLTHTLYNIVVQKFGENTLERRIDARRAVWKDSVWVFQDGYRRVFTGKTDSVRAFKSYVDTLITETPADFDEKPLDEDEMTANELRDYIHKVRRSGGNVERIMVNLYFKFSFPFSGLMFVLIGIAFAAGRRKPSMATGFGMTLAVSFLYYVVLRVGQTLGHNGVLPPLLAAQAGNIIFLVIGSVLVGRANR